MTGRPTFPHDDGARAEVPVGFAIGTWVCTWVVGQLLAGVVVALSGYEKFAEAGPAWLLGVAVVTWVPMVLGMVWVAGRVTGDGFGLRGLVGRYGLSFSRRDLWGVPIGIGTQVVLLPLVYLPLRAWWPATFGQDDVEQRARDLAGNAHGLRVVLLAIAVVGGAPIVEELVYRGLLQGSFVRRLGRWPGTVIVAVWFAAVHFQPIELPGLTVIGLVLGACALLTGRLGMGVVAHLAFNLTGLLLVS